MIRTLMFACSCIALVWPLPAAADVVLDWNDTIKKVIKDNGLHEVNQANPGWSTRAMAMMNGAIYDVFQAVDRTHVPFLVNTHAAPNTSLEAAVHQAAYELLTNLYPGESAKISTYYNPRIDAVTPGVAKNNGISLGSQIAQAYIANRTGDNADITYPYTPLEGPGKWRPDPYNPDQEAWGPGWRNVQPFAIPNSADFVGALPPIPDLTSAEYAAAFQQVYEYGAIDSAVRTPEQEEIALFWAYDRPTMGPPPVLFLRNVVDVAMQAGTSPAENARLFALSSIAMADAAISAWDAKFEHNFWRPVAAIHEADIDGNPMTTKDDTWRPLGAPGEEHGEMMDDFTPPFPAWTSGHATMGAAVFKALEQYFGTNSFGDIVGDPGATYFLTSEEDGSGHMRWYSTFTQTAPLDIGAEDSPEGENGTSRLYLGIHWIFDQVDGITLGRNIADHVARNYFYAVPEPGAIALVLLGAGMAGVGYRCRRDG